MPTVHPAWVQEWLQAIYSSDPGLKLLTVVHPMLETFRLVENTVDVTSRGNLFKKAFFAINVVNDDDSPPRAQLTIPNVDKEIGIWLKSIVNPPEIILEVVSSFDLDYVVYRCARLQMIAPDVQEQTVSGTLTRRDDGSELCGSIRMTPRRAPGLFIGLRS